MVGKKAYVLMILDGWGIGEKNRNNAVHIANTPFLDKLAIEYPKTTLACSGDSVGLPNRVMGNSEVGHLNIGAGRVVYQDLLRINRAIEDKSFHKSVNLNITFDKVLDAGSSLHLMGLLSDGGVHSQITHLYSLIDLAKSRNINKVFVHAILDGRDTAPDKGVEYIRELQSYLNKLGCGSISTICGRYYAMDRDQRWDRIEKAYRLYTQGIGRLETDPVEAVKQSYLRDETDEFIRPIIINNIGCNHDGLFCDDDAIIFFNFRADRARQLSCALTKPEFKHFHREYFPRFSEYLTMTMYDESLDLPNILPPVKMNGLMGEIISNNGLTQLRIAETEKYAHVTYFFNGGIEDPFLNEDRCLVPSPRDVDTYDQKPEMSAYLVAEEVIKQIKSNKYDFIVINFANMDMVGHTGSFSAAVEACETVDKCVEKVIKNLLNNNGVALITADHGNSEKMSDCNGKPFTAHTKNEVPLIAVGNDIRGMILKHGSLCDIAPTILYLMELEKSAGMTGKSLFVM